MAKNWLTERLTTFIPAIEALGTDQEAEIERLCIDEVAAWKERGLQLSSLRVPMTATRKRLKAIALTPANSWSNPRTGEPEHIALKYMNFTPEEWREMNAISEETFQARLQDRQLFDDPRAIVARAEKLLTSDRWYELVTGLAIATGRRLTEILKTARFFPQGLYTVTFDGQLKRKDLHVAPYEIPTLVPAELVIAAWRRLRTLVDTTALDNEQVAAKYNKDASQCADLQFAGFIPQKSGKENLHTHALRACYARIAVHWFAPVQVLDVTYVAAILGHYYTRDEKEQRDAATTEHYFDYAINDGTGNIDGRQGLRLDEPGITVLEMFRSKGDATMTTSAEETTQGEQEQVLTVKPAKKRGTLTTTPGTFDMVTAEMRNRGFLKHEEIVTDYMSHDAVAHQMYTLLQPLGEQLGASTPVATLQALIAAYQGGSFPAMAGVSELLQSVGDEKNPIEYLSTLVERDRKFKAGIASRYSSETDYSTWSWDELDGHKTKAPEAATERYRRAVNAIIAHNRQAQDRLHRWFINAAIVRDLVGGRNEKVQAYLATRAEEIDAHHKEFNPPLTAKLNNKDMDIKEDIKAPFPG
jgi:Telomere resolvase